MSLDVYVGSLTRYYLQEWETSVQKAAREAGRPVEVVRPEDPEDAITDPTEIREAVTMWRDAMSEALGEHLSEPLDWDEAESSPYFTEQITWDAYASLLLWAAYAEHDDLQCPTDATDEWAEDEAYQRSADADFDTDYAALLRQTSIWLPTDFDFTFVSEDLSGEEAAFGSSVQLAGQLFDLNTKTWKADESTIAGWRKACPEDGASLETNAKYAFAVLLELAREATRNKLVMRLDF